MPESDAARANAFHVREAHPGDIPALMRLKYLLAQGENALHAVRATEAHWLRDGFGPGAGFCAFVAERSGFGNAVAGNPIVGMATCSSRVVTGWDGPVVFLQDLFVEPDRRESGIARALMARVAAYAREIGSPIVELTVRADNAAAQSFYRNAGCMPLPQCLTYVLAGAALAELADRNETALALAG
jgi:ribosomal protein S18 acetylase RimI-like enzyme